MCTWNRVNCVARSCCILDSTSKTIIQNGRRNYAQYIIGIAHVGMFNNSAIWMMIKIKLQFWYARPDKTWQLHCIDNAFYIAEFDLITKMTSILTLTINHNHWNQSNLFMTKFITYSFVSHLSIFMNRTHLNFESFVELHFMF